MLAENVKVKVEQIVKAHLETETDISGEALSDLGINSIDALELLIELENEFDIEIPDEDLNADLFSSIDYLSNYIYNVISNN